MRSNSCGNKCCKKPSRFAKRENPPIKAFVESDWNKHNKDNQNEPWAKPPQNPTAESECTNQHICERRRRTTKEKWSYVSQLFSVFAGDGDVLAVFNERMCCDASKMLRCDCKIKTKHIFNVVVGKIQQLLQSLSNRRKRALQRNNKSTNLRTISQTFQIINSRWS